jgi:hypothetical protein
VDDIAQALLEISGLFVRRKEMRELGLVRARVFSWPETARGTLAALNEMS